MAKTRPTTPPKAPRPRRAFDEQLWPVNVAILVMGGFVAGIILSQSRLDDPHFLQNGWTRLAALAGVLGGLIWLVAKLDNRRVRRGLQLAALVSLFVHICAMILLRDQHFTEIADSSRPTAQKDEVAIRGPRLVTKESSPAAEAAANEFTKPVETEIAPEQEQRVEVVREPMKLDDTPKTQPSAEPAVAPQARPGVVEMRRPDEPATPKQPSRAVTPDRQVAKVEPRAGAAAAVPDSDSTAAAKGIDAQVTLERRSQELAMAKPAGGDAGKNPAQPQAARLAARAKVEGAAPDVAAPAAAGKQAKIASVSPGKAKLPEAAPSGGGGKLEPNAALARREPGAPVAGKAGGGAAEPKNSTIAQVASIDNRARSGDLPQLASPKSTSRATSAASPAAAKGELPKVAAGGSSEADARLAPAAGPLARGTSGGGGALPGSPAPSDVKLPAAGASGLAGLPIDRAQASNIASLNPQAARTDRVARASRVAKVPASPAAIENPGGADAAEPGPGSAQPGGRTTLPRRATGIAGVGRDENLQPGIAGLGELAAASGRSSPGAAPKRAAAAQPFAAGSGAPGAGLPADVPRTKVASRAAAVNRVADDASLAAVGGNGGTGVDSGAPGGVEASASAAVQRGSAGSAPSTSSAVGKRGAGTGGAGIGPAGTGGVDVGPTQIAANFGASRTGSGGGSPRVTGDAQGQRIAKAGLGGDAIATIAARNAAAAAEAPAGNGGGAPLGQGGDSSEVTLTANGAASAITRGAGGGGLPGGTGTGGATGDPAAGSGTGSGGGLGVGVGGGGTSKLATASISRAATGDGSGGGSSGTGRGGSGSAANAGGSGLAGRRGTAAATASGTADLAGIPGGDGTGDGGGSGGSTDAPNLGEPQFAGNGGNGGGNGVGGNGVGGGGNGGGGRSAAGLPTGTAGAGVGTVLGDGGGVGGLGRPGVGTGSAGASRSAAVGEGSPQLAGATTPSDLRRAVPSSTTSGVMAAINGNAADLAEASAASASDVGGAAAPAGVAPGETGVARRGNGGTLPTEVASLPTLGGLGAGVSLEVGSLNRRARVDNEPMQTGTSRFLARAAGGPLTIDTRARQPTEAYAGRAGQRKAKKGGGGISERNEQAIAKGLAFLARHQSEDGRWSLNNYGAGQPGYEDEHASFNSDTAATGLALLSFLGAGYDHFDDEYRHVVREGFDFSWNIKNPNGDLYVPGDAESNRSAWYYSHGIATIALCEAYGMTGDEALRVPAQKAVDFIAASQSPRLGAWRYAPQYGSDTSASGWQLMALKSGELAGLRIQPETYPRVKVWLDGAQVSKTDGSQYVYNPFAADTDQQRHGRRTTPAMTAVGLLMRMYLGWNRDDPRMIAGAEHLLDELPSMGTKAQPARDTYYWYYATQVMFHMRGKYWKEWNERLHPLLVERQVPDGPMAGSWDPMAPVPDRWGAAGGRIYVTTLNLLSLEVYYRHLPIYEATAK